MTEKRTATSPLTPKEKTRQKAQTISRASAKKLKGQQDAKTKISARVAVAAQKAKKKEKVINAMKYSHPEAGIPENPRLVPQGKEDTKNIYFKALGARIAKRAYELYEAKGGGHGHDLEDWLEAERQILSVEVVGEHPN
ncbi:DUF2934 domain-containing protein [Candidatus Nitronereus thalassa]|uniref:DUF2934 domain-containing protein n=1 Tax=Candidatus Nitronereus thalassa TaxID=3020898 RepID=A0ABU3KBI5_9BACT|nr:DUF2934 domain-containing protein [Candidatus Nitronereus thalassa]MDT7043756.1 DUF2934 domain-containing protein [Candidatus Nitronereus thalassa]